MAHRRIPLWVKLVYTGFVGVVVPYYWVTYTPWNFLYSATSPCSPRRSASGWRARC